MHEAIEELGVDAELAAALVDAAPDGIVVIDRTGTIRLVNCQVEEMFGYPRGELIGQPVEVLLPAGRRQVHRAHRLRYVAEPHVRPMGADLDLWGRRADGAEFPVEVSLSPCSGRHGELMIAAVRDISARRVAEQHVRNLTRLLDGINEAVFVVDPDTLRFTYVNRAGCALTGYRADELASMTPAHLSPEFDALAWQAQLEPVLAGQQGSQTIVTALRRQDGSEVTIEADISFPQAETGQPRQLVAVIRDITSRLAAEAELRAAQALVALVDDRERIARDLHDTAVQELFAAGLTIQGLAMRADGDLADKLGKLVDRTDRVIREIRTAIFGLTSRRAGSSVIDGAQAIVDESARLLGFRPVLRVAGAVDTSTSADVAAQLLPSLREALSNVARHAEATRVDVDLDHDGAVLTLRVSDNGKGLPRESHGAGHGLTNLAQRAEAVGGKLTITSEPGTGTTLTWTAPT